MGRHDTTLTAFETRSALARGLYASTPVQTAFGWRFAGDLAPGDLVMTQEAGLSPILTVATEARTALWSVRLPEGALGNPQALMLPPGQPVLIRSRHAMPFSGDDLALVPATALEGWRGIAPHVPARAEPMLQLRLHRPGLICAGPGLFLGCEGSDPASFDLRRLLDEPARPCLPLAAARHMIAQLVAEEASGTLAGLQAAVLRPPNLP
jgi:hypothetical protein